MAGKHCLDHRTFPVVFLESFGVQRYIRSAEWVLFLEQKELATAKHFDVDCKGTAVGQILWEMPCHHCNIHSVVAKLRVHRMGSTVRGLPETVVRDREIL